MNTHFGPGVSLKARSRVTLSLLSHNQRKQAKQGAWNYEPRYPPLTPVGEGRWMFWMPEGC